MEKIDMTVKKFFSSLPKLRKYKPVVTKSGRIRLGQKTKGYSMCPLTALRKELTGVAGDINHVYDYFKFKEDKNDKLDFTITTLVEAADYKTHSKDEIKYRKRMLEGLGLDTNA